MSAGIQSDLRGLPGSKVTVIADASSEQAAAGIEIVPAPNKFRRRLCSPPFTTSSEEFHSDFSAMCHTLRVVSPSENAASVEYRIDLVTTTAEGLPARYVLQTMDPGADEGALLPGQERRLQLCTMLMEDEHLELVVLNTEGGAAQLNVFSNFLDVPASTVGRRRIELPAVPMNDVPEPEPVPWDQAEVAVPDPGPGKMHVVLPDGRQATPNISAVAPPPNITGSTPEFALDDNGTIIPLGTPFVGGGSVEDGRNVNEKVQIYLRQGQQLLVRENEGGPGVYLSAYLTVSDPGVGSPGSSA